MGTSVERLRPKQLTQPKKSNGRALAVFDSPGTVAPHLNVANRLRQMEFRDVSFQHSNAAVRWATEERTKWLPLFDPADAADLALLRLNGGEYWPVPPLERAQALKMLTALLGAFGAKDDRDIMLGMLDMLESGEVAAASGMWQPLRVSPVALALACRQLIATATFPPRAAELREACSKANCTLRSAQRRCHELVEYVRRRDAILLEFAPDEWRAPYLTPQYQNTVQRLLELHAIDGNGDEDFGAEEPDEDAPEEKPANRSFRLALMRARQEFPKEVKLEPKRAACRTTTATRTHKPGRSRKTHQRPS